MKRTGKAIGTLAAATSLALASSGLTGAAQANPGNSTPKSDNSPPVITVKVSGTQGLDGWYTSNVTVTWDVKDGQSDITKRTGCDPVTLSTDTAGTTYTCEATSAGGTSKESVTVKRDATKPVVRLADVAPSSYEGETPSAPTCSSSDATSGLGDADTLSAGQQDCVVSGWSTALGSHNVSATAVDRAGNTSSTTAVTHQVLDDTSAPTVTPSVSGTKSATGWYTDDATVSFAVVELETPRSLMTGAGCTASEVTVDTTGTDRTCSASSLGGTSEPVTVTVKRDTVGPTDVLLASGGPQAGETYVLGNVPAGPGCSAEDATSGVDRCEVTGYSSEIGQHTLTATAFDRAGHSTVGETRSYTVIADDTPPVIEASVVGTEGDNGWYVGDVTVTWSVTDQESVVSDEQGCELVEIVTDQVETGYTCTATSAGGTGSKTVKVKRDATAPVVAPGDVEESVWRATALTEEFTASDETSGLAEPADAAFTLTASDESRGTDEPTLDERTVADKAGNSVTRSLSALIDTSGPAVTGGDVTVSTWRNSPLSASFTASDTRSGLLNTEDGSFTLNTQGDSPDATTPVIASKTVMDAVGNATKRTISAMVDTVKPTSTVSGVTNGAIYTVNSVPTAGCTGSDDLSGKVSDGTPTGAGTAPGRYTVTCNGATDKAGNSQTVASTAVSYVVAGLGKFSKNFDGSSVPRAKAGSALPLGWALSDGTATNYALLSTASVTSASISSCTDDAGTTSSEVAEVTSGGSGLQLLADSSYQLNVKTSTTQTGCRRYTVSMTTAAGNTLSRSVNVQLVK